MLIPAHPIKASFGAGGFAVFGLFLSAAAPMSRFEMVLFSAASLAPYLLLILFDPQGSSHSRGFVRAAGLGQRVAVAWYLVAYLVACGLAMRDGLRTAELVFLVAALLGVWPCIIALSRWRKVP
jgi:hypothetical protein